MDSYNPSPDDLKKYTNKHDKEVESVRHKAIFNIQRGQKKQKEKFWSSRKRKMPEICKGDEICVVDSRRKGRKEKKLESLYNGPYKVAEVLPSGQKKQKEKFRRSRKRKMSEICEGNEICVTDARRKGRKEKRLEPLYNGPYKVTEVLPSAVKYCKEGEIITARKDQVKLFHRVRNSTYLRDPLSTSFQYITHMVVSHGRGCISMYVEWG